ncbi:VWA domain-containing protein [Oleiharenicola lentus]|uniref:VWA domain-containing protein n=1 Tax=Oleiharenicola lentus TaxID=2508720 RepID=UPI003F67AE74
MNFGNPWLLCLLVIPALLALVDLFRQGTMAAIWPRVNRLWASRHAIDLHTPSEKPRPRWFLWSGLALLIIAFAQPRYGPADVPVDQTPREVLIALDLSRSMLARDVRPSRLEHAKLLTRGLLDKLAGEHAGLVLFSSSAYLQIPLSEDYETISTLLPGLSPTAFPRSGSDFAAMLRTALESFSSLDGVNRYLVVLSDGEAFNENWKPLLAQYRERGIRIVSAGIGTVTGAVIPGADELAMRDPATGLEVITRFRSATLQTMATETKGQYLEANTWLTLTETIRRLELGEKKKTVLRKDDHLLVERFRWTLIPGLVLLWLSFCRELPVRPSQRRMARRNFAPSLANVAGGRAAATALALVMTVTVCQPVLWAHDPEPVSSDLAEQEAQDDDPDKPTPMTRIGSMVGRRITEILANPNASSDDYAALVIDMMAFAENHLKARQRFPNSVIEDALVAANRGEKIAPEGGDWARFRKELNAMREANSTPWKTVVADAAGKSDLATGFDPDHDMQTNGKGSGGVPSDPAAQQALDDLKKKIGQNAAFGAMGEEKKATTAMFDEPPPPPADSHVIGGHNHEEEHEIEAHPELVLPLQRLALVRAQDTPAKLFQMLEGNDASAFREGPEW